MDEAVELADVVPVELAGLVAAFVTVERVELVTCGC